MSFMLLFYESVGFNLPLSQKIELFVIFHFSAAHPIWMWQTPNKVPRLNKLVPT